MREQYKALRALVKGDGCTASPDLRIYDACLEHDRDYTTRRDEKGRILSRFKADNRFLHNMRKAAPNWLVRNTLPFVYYAAVRVFGGAFWRDNGLCN